LSSAVKVASAVSSVANVAGVLGAKPENYSQSLSAQGGTADMSGASLMDEAAQAAQEEELRRKRKGSGANINTSPLGLTSPGQSAATALLG